VIGTASSESLVAELELVTHLNAARFSGGCDIPFLSFPDQPEPHLGAAGQWHGQVALKLSKHVHSALDLPRWWARASPRLKPSPQPKPFPLQLPCKAMENLAAWSGRKGDRPGVVVVSLRKAERPISSDRTAAVVVGSSRQSAATDVAQLIYFSRIRMARTRPAACEKANGYARLHVITLSHMWLFAWPKARESLTASEPRLIQCTASINSLHYSIRLP
jgi:hypothetical protein